MIAQPDARLAALVHALRETAAFLEDAGEPGRCQQEAATAAERGLLGEPPLAAVGERRGTAPAYADPADRVLLVAFSVGGEEQPRPVGLPYDLPHRPVVETGELDRLSAT